MSKLKLIFLSLFFVVRASVCQDTASVNREHTLWADLMVESHGFGIDYEVKVIQKNLLSVKARTGISVMPYFWIIYGVGIPSAIILDYGNKNSFQMGMGFSFLYMKYNSKWGDHDIYVSCMYPVLGYRHKLSKNLIFKAEIAPFTFLNYSKEFDENQRMDSFGGIGFGIRF